jgi:VWFA-related protein
MRRFVAPVVFGVLVVCTIAFQIAGRAQAPAQTPPRFTAGVDIVEMPVTVLDKDHKPVRGLTAKDFTVVEDGKPQKIVAFSEFVPAPPVVPSARWMREVPRDVETNAVVDKNLFVIVIDDATLSPATVPPGGGRPGGGGRAAFGRVAEPGPSMDVYRLDTLRKVAHRAIDLLGDGDLAAVVFANDNFKGQTFTSDRSKLIRSVDSVTFGPAYYKDDLFPVATDCQPLWFTTGALRASVEALASAPHGRKTVLYVTIGLDMPILGKPRPAYQNCASKAQDDVLEIFRMAQLSNVNVYSVDPSGLRAVLTDDDRQRHEFLREVAENTGGRAVIDTNDDVGHVAAIFEEVRSYYLLAYELTDRKGDGKFHRVEVKVDRPGVEVLTRKMRYDAVPPASVAKVESSPTATAVSDFLPKGDIFAEAAVAPFASRDGATVLVSVAGRLPAVSGPLSQDHIDLLIRAFTPDGRAAGSHQELVAVTLSPPASAAPAPPTVGPGFELASRIDAKPGRYSLRIGLRSAGTDKTGSVYADVVVPDFAKEPLSMSGMVLSESTGSLRGDALAALTPTTTREFDAPDRMQAFLRVYQGGTVALSPVSLRVRIVDEHDAAVIDRPESLPATAFSHDRQVDYSFKLPLSTLKAGEYWLSIEAAIGKRTVKRDVRFRIR